MIFFTGLVVGAVAGAAAYHWFYSIHCSKTELICNDKEKDREISKQLERLIAYGNDI